MEDARNRGQQSLGAVLCCYAVVVVVEDDVECIECGSDASGLLFLFCFRRVAFFWLLLVAWPGDQSVQSSVKREQYFIFTEN